MPKKDLTDIICVIDKSGSMESIATDAIGGFNSFLEGQKAAPGEANMTIALFDTEYKLKVSGMKIREVRGFNRKNYVPGGCTALLDAVGRTIDEVGARLAKTPEQERPEKVIFAILTDGEENSSTDYTQKQIKEKIQHQSAVYQWQFIFLAANQDAFESAESIGISRDHAANFTADAEGVEVNFCMMNDAVASYRESGKVRKDWNQRGK